MGLECAPVYYRLGSALLAKSDADVEKQRASGKEDEEDEAAAVECVTKEVKNDLNAGGGGEEEEDADAEDEDAVDDVTVALENMWTAKEIYERNLPHIEDWTVKMEYSYLLLRLGDAFQNQAAYKDSLIHYNECLKVRQSILYENDKTIANVYYNMAISCQYLRAASTKEEEAKRHTDASNRYFNAARPIFQARLRDCEKALEEKRAESEGKEGTIRKGRMINYSMDYADCSIEELEQEYADIVTMIEGANYVHVHLKNRPESNHPFLTFPIYQKLTYIFVFHLFVMISRR